METKTNEKPAVRRPTKKGFFQTLLIIAIMVVITLAAGKVLRSKTGDANIMLDPKLEQESWDVIFAGSSHMNNALYPVQLWKEYGIASYNNAQSGEVIPVSYYTCKEIIERMHPKVLVLDVYMLYHPRKDGSISWMHQSLDTLSPQNRIAAIRDLVPAEQQTEFLFPLALYHTRWKELTDSDFADPAEPARLGSSTSIVKATELAGYSYEEIPANIKVRPSDIPVLYLEKIVNICEETGTQLLLVALPYMTSPDVPKPTHKMDQDQAYFNWVSDFAEEHHLNFVNYFHLTDEIGFIWPEHMKDYSHMNIWGGQLITSHLGAYLTEHYDLEDHRGQKAYKIWDKRVTRYDKNIEKLMEKVK